MVQKIESEMDSLQDELDNIPIVGQFQQSQTDINYLLQMVVSIIQDTVAEKITLDGVKLEDPEAATNRPKGEIEMRPFAYHNPTRLYFGEGQLQQLAKEADKLGKRVLLLYGGGSIKKSGLYDEVLKSLGEAGCTVTELGGVEPNPRLSTVHRGAELCRSENIDWVLAVGGGSTLDCGKAIVAAAHYEGNFWDIVSRKANVESALPLGTVLTLAATGSEMNSGSVITNEETEEKHGWGSPLVFPRFSVLDPVYTATAPKDHTVYGMVDMMSHVLEQYFHHDAATPVQDGFCESIYALGRADGA